MFVQDEFNEFVVANEVIGFFEKPVVLNSGRLSHWYVNWRTVMEDAYLADCLMKFVVNFVWERMPDTKTIYGVPEGATKLAILAQAEWARRQTDYGAGRYSLAMGRGRAKEHGEPKDRFFLGVPKGETVVLEDVTTTGGSLIKTVNSLALAQVKIIAAIGLTNREELNNDGRSVELALADAHVNYFAMSRATELLPIVFARKRPPGHIKAEIAGYFERHGAKKLVL